MIGNSDTITNSDIVTVYLSIIIPDITLKDINDKNLKISNNVTCSGEFVILNIIIPVITISLHLNILMRNPINHSWK